MAADLSFFGGILSALVGSALTAAGWIVGAKHPAIRILGTTFLVLTIPLLIFAGYCLDWMEQKIKTHHSGNSRTG